VSLDTITPSGSHLRTLAHCRTTSCFIGDYVWSHDGKKLAFLQGTLGRTVGNVHHTDLSVFVVNANGTGEQRLAGCGTYAGCSGLDWSPDDTHLVMARSQDAGHTNLFDLTVKTHGLRQLTHCGTKGVGLCEERSPQWSPDGSRIAFDRTVDTASRQEGGVYVVRVDGSGLKKLTNNIWTDASPSWSPDGRQIAFGEIWLYVMNADGSHRRKLRQIPKARGFNVAWDPSGAWILYTGSPYGVPGGSQTHTWLIRPNGTGRRLLYPLSGEGILTCSALAGYGGEPCVSPAKITWSPDGQNIAFSAAGLFIMHADGTHIQRILPRTVGTPAWQPVP
jgi:TolB protein